MIDRFLKTCLVLIVLLLSVIAVRVIAPYPVQAQGQRKYVAVRCFGGPQQDGHSIQGTLDQYSADGWELVAPLFADKDATGNAGEIYLIFRK